MAKKSFVLLSAGLSIIFCNPVAAAPDKIAMSIVAPQAELKQLFGPWHGTMHSSDADADVSLSLTGQDQQSVEGTLLCTSKDGTAKHYVRGRYDPQQRQFDCKDVGIERVAGIADWFPTPIDHYSFTLVESETKLVGTCKQHNATEDIWINLQRGAGKKSSSVAAPSGIPSPTKQGLATAGIKANAQSQPTTTPPASEVKNESLEHLMSDLQTQERLFGKTSEAAVSAWFKLALWHQENGQPDQARVEQEQALKLLPQITEGNPFLQGQMNGFIFKLGDGYVRSQQYDRAQSLYETLTRLNEKQDGGDDSIIQAQDFIRLAQISLATRNQPQVTEYVKKAVDIVTRIGGPNYKNDADKLRSLQNTAAAAEVGRMRAIIDSIADKQNRIDFGPYMADLQQKIKTNWQPAPSRSTKKVTVRFDLHTDGTISNLRIEDSSGLNEADKAALEAVQKSVPFAMLPKDAVEHVSVRFTFARNVVHRARSPWVPVYIPLRTR